MSDCTARVVAGYQNKDKLAEMLSGASNHTGGQLPQAGLGGLIGNLSGKISGAGLGGLLNGGLGELVERYQAERPRGGGTVLGQ